MSKSLLLLTLSGSLLLGASCSKRERSDPDAEEWSEIEAMADDAKVVLSSRPSDSKGATSAGEPVTEGEFDGFVQRMEQMKSVEREAGQTLLTGTTLVFDYQARFVRMDGDVLVDDDHGQLKAESLTGRFSDSNQVELIEAKGGVLIDSGERKARADEAVYDYLSGTLNLKGRAAISAGGNNLSGEEIRCWIRGDSRIICEPNALLRIAGSSETGIDGMPEGIGDTEIRANRIMYNGSDHRADLVGNVRLRNPKVAMNCGEIHLFLKDNNKIDWIEAVDEVIIQSEDRKALADLAIYNAGEGKFTLEGRPPMVKQGRNVMTGDRIVYWHKTRAVLCEPNGRVLYFYDLDEETKARFPKDLND